MFRKHCTASLTRSRTLADGLTQHSRLKTVIVQEVRMRAVLVEQTRASPRGASEVVGAEAWKVQIDGSCARNVELITPHNFL